MPARILVIEDNKANLELMTYLLKAFGHTAFVAQDGEAGLDAAYRETLDLIICDIELPKVNGYEIARRLKRHPTLRQLPLIAVTAFAMVDDREKAMAAGFDGYIPKPIEPELFVGQVEAFLRSGKITATPRGMEPVGNYSQQEVEDKHIAILVVDNTPENLQLMQGLLEPNGYTVIAVRTVSEAMNVLAQASIDLIISDVHMPVSGYDFLSMIRADAALRRVPFMFLSSSRLHGEDSGRALQMGATRFLNRPIESEELLAEIEACLKSTRR